MSIAGVANSDPAAAATPTACPYEHSDNLVEVLGQIGGSLLITTYQAGCVAAMGVSRGSIFVSLHHYERAMGLAVAPDRVAIGGGPQIWFLQSMPELARWIEPAGKFDSCYVTRSSHVTAEIHSHEMGFSGVQLWFVNTLFSCLCTLHPRLSFLPQWKPSFVSAMAPEDRCHLNGMALEHGRPRYVTALGQTDTAQGWRQVKANGGCLIDVPGNAIVAHGLSMPHSPRLHQDRLWMLDSGTARLVTVDPNSGALETVAVLPGFTRGLSFAGPYAFVGLSRVRESATFGDLPIAPKRDRLKCGMAVVELASGNVVSLFEFKEGIHEIFAVEVLAGTTCPAISGPFVDKDNTQPIYTMPDNWVQKSPQSV